LLRASSSACVAVPGMGEQSSGTTILVKVNLGLHLTMRLGTKTKHSNQTKTKHSNQKIHALCRTWILHVNLFSLAVLCIPSDERPAMLAA
jgi:hypothetical protein